MGYFGSIISDAKRSSRSVRHATGNIFFPTGEISESFVNREHPMQTQVEHAVSSQYDIKSNNHSALKKNKKLPDLTKSGVEHTNAKITDKQERHDVHEVLNVQHPKEAPLKEDKHPIKPEGRLIPDHMKGPPKEKKVNDIKPEQKPESMRVKHQKIERNIRIQQLNNRQEKNGIDKLDLIKSSKIDEIQNKNSYSITEKRPNTKHKNAGIEILQTQPIGKVNEQKKSDNRYRKIEEIKGDMPSETFSVDKVVEAAENIEPPIVELHLKTDKQRENTPNHGDRHLMSKILKTSKAVEHPSESPKVFIGQIDVYVSAPEKLVPAQNQESTSSSFQSRYYIKGL